MPTSLGSHSRSSVVDRQLDEHRRGERARFGDERVVDAQLGLDSRVA